MAMRCKGTLGYAVMQAVRRAVVPTVQHIALFILVMLLTVALGLLGGR